MVDNEFGYSRHGEPVFPEFSDQRHVAPQPLQFLPNLPVIVGLDAGLHPAALFRQQTPAGQVRWVAELYFGRMGSTRFGEMAQRFIAEKIPQNCRLTGYADPSAGDGADKEGGELSWIETIQHALGFPILQAPSNELPLRLDAVRQPLTTLIEGEPGFVLSPACRVARRGFNSGYHFVRVRNSNGEFHRDVPNKAGRGKPYHGRGAVCGARRPRPLWRHPQRPAGLHRRAGAHRRAADAGEAMIITSPRPSKTCAPASRPRVTPPGRSGHMRSCSGANSPVELPQLPQHPLTQSRVSPP